MLKTIKTVPFSQWTGFKKNFLLLLLSLLCFINFTQTVSAQFSSSVLSGNDPASYVCPGEDPGLPVKSADDTCSAADGKCRTLPYLDSTSGYYVCKSDTGIVRATLKAPPLQQLELWFRRILYAIWAIVGSFSFVMLIYLGYQYMIRGGTSDQELVKLRKAIINYVVGFALVFLSIPILTTFFTVLGINKNVTCYDVAMPGFQFFFSELCTDPKYILVNDPCTYYDKAEGYACPEVGETGVRCIINPTINPTEIQYKCISIEGSSSGAGIWKLIESGVHEEF